MILFIINKNFNTQGVSQIYLFKNVIILYKAKLVAFRNLTKS